MLDDCTILVKDTGTTFSKAGIFGSQAQQQQQQLQKQLEEILPLINKVRDTLINLVSSNKPGEAEKLKTDLKTLYSEEFSIYKKALNRKTCRIRAVVMKTIINGAKYIPNSVLADFYAGLGQDIKRSKWGAEIKKIINLAPGTYAPLFTGYTPDNKKISLTDFRGKYVLLEFWGSWCVPCREENPFLIELYKKFRGDKFELVGIAKEEENEQGRKKWLAAIEQDRLPWPNILCTNPGNLEPLDDLYSVKSYPTNFLIGPDGLLVEINIKGPALEKLLEKLLR